MPCPVCVIDCLVIASCRFFGIPDVITAYLIGILTLSVTIVTIQWMKAYFKVEKAPKYTLLLILVLYSTITIIAMEAIGMW